jgi:hypothetical protein
VVKYKKHSRNFQAPKNYVVDRATSLGPIELMNCLGFAYRSQPRELRKIEKKYIQHCVWLYRRLEQVGR